MSSIIARLIQADKERDREMIYGWGCMNCGEWFYYDSDTTSPLHCPECLKDDFKRVEAIDKQ